MRTTLNLDDEVYEFVRACAAVRSEPIGKVVSDLIKRAVEMPLRTRVENGFHVVDLPAGGRPIYKRRGEAFGRRVRVSVYLLDANVTPEGPAGDLR